MLQNESVVKIVDNSWAKEGLIIRVLKWWNARFAKIGDKVVVAIKEATPTAQVKKWEVSRALIVRVKKEIKRADWTYIRFWDNAAILVQKDAKEGIKPLWKRIFGPVAKELREMWYKSIANLSEEIV